MKISSKKKLNYALIEIGLIIVSLIMFMPFLLALFISFMEPTEVFTYPPKLFPLK